MAPTTDDVVEVDDFWGSEYDADADNHVEAVNTVIANQLDCDPLESNDCSSASSTNSTRSTRSSSQTQNKYVALDDVATPADEIPPSNDGVYLAVPIAQDNELDLADAAHPIDPTDPIGSEDLTDPADGSSGSDVDDESNEETDCPSDASLQDDSQG